MINTEIWDTFLEYADLISSEGPKRGLDVYGTEQRTNLAAYLTFASILKNIDNKLSSIAQNISGN